MVRAAATARDVQIPKQLRLNDIEAARPRKDDAVCAGADRRGGFVIAAG
jgi:hypothetical protein